MKQHPHSEEAWRRSIARGRLEDNKRAKGNALTWVILSALLSVGAVTGASSMRDGAELQRCANGEIHMPAWERGLDGVLQRRGAYCYRADPDEMKGLWTIDDEGLPASLARKRRESSDD